MASNLHFGGTAGQGIFFDRAIGHLLVNVTTATITLSFDQGANAITLPIGFHSFPVGTINQITIGGAGVWELVAIQD